MGVCCCGPSLDANTRYINEKMDAANKLEGRTNKLLFLGPGGSGKSTIVKQLKLLHDGPFADRDASLLKEHIYSQITSQMKDALKHFVVVNTQSDASRAQSSSDAALLANTTDNAQQQQQQQQLGGGGGNVTYSGDEETTIANAEEKKYDVNEMERAIKVVQNHSDVTVFTEELADAISFIYSHERRISAAFQHVDTAQNKVLVESTAYFWSEISRIKQADYTPTEEDIIKVRYRTTGVVDTFKFEIKGAKFHIYDAGGQKSERKKWIHCFTEVKAVVFVVAMSCYNEMMFEDLNKNCMDDSLELFDSVINNKFFVDTHIILFLNKRDLFEEKISKIAITACPKFGDFMQFKPAQKEQEVFNPDPNNYEQATIFMRWKFETLNRNPKKKQIYTHLTCGLDKKNIDNVFNDVKHIVITQNLYNEGLS